MEKKAVAIAVQLGTSCYRVGCLDNGAILQLPNQFGEDETAAYYASTGTEILYGADAKNYAAIDANAVVSNPMKNLCNEIDPIVWPNHFSPRTVLRDTIQALLRDTVSNWSENAEIRAVVASVPEAYLHCRKAEIIETVLQALPEAAAVLTIPKSTAAFLGYALSRTQCEDGIYLVLVVGSYLTELNTFRVENETAVCLTSPHTYRFGGQDFDEVLAEHCCQHFHGQTGVDIRENRGAMYRLRAHCEMAKRKLSTASVAVAEIPQLLPGKLLKVQITRKEMEANMMEPVERLITWLIKQIESCCLPISAVVIAGGACRIPSIQSRVEALFSPEQVKTSCHAIAHCAAIRGATGLTSMFSNRDLFVNLAMNANTFSIIDIRHAMNESGPLLDVRRILEESTTKIATDRKMMESITRNEQSNKGHFSNKSSSVSKKEISASEEVHTIITTKSIVRNTNTTETVSASKRPRIAMNFDVPSFHCRAVVTEYVRYSKGGITGAIKKGWDSMLSAVGLKESYETRSSYSAKLEAYFSEATYTKLTLQILPEEQDVCPITLPPGSFDGKTHSKGDDTLMIQLKEKDLRSDRLLDDSFAVRFGFRFPSHTDCGRMKSILRDYSHRATNIDEISERRVSRPAAVVMSHSLH